MSDSGLWRSDGGNWKRKRTFNGLATVLFNIAQQLLSQTPMPCGTMIRSCGTMMRCYRHHSMMIWSRYDDDLERICPIVQVSGNSANFIQIWNKVACKKTVKYSNALLYVLLLIREEDVLHSDAAFSLINRMKHISWGCRFHVFINNYKAGYFGRSLVVGYPYPFSGIVEQQ